MQRCSVLISAMEHAYRKSLCTSPGQLLFPTANHPGRHGRLLAHPSTALPLCCLPGKVIYRHCLGSVSHTWFFCSHPAVPGTAAGPLPSRGALPRLCRHGVTCARAAVPHSAAGAGGEGRAQSILCTLGDFSPIRQVQGTASAGLFGLVCREHVGHVPV